MQIESVKATNEARLLSFLRKEYFSSIDKTSAQLLSILSIDALNEQTNEREFLTTLHQTDIWNEGYLNANAFASSEQFPFAIMKYLKKEK